MAIYKNANLDISVSAEQNPSYNAKPSVQFSTQDKNTAKYTFTVKQNNKPVDLTGVTASVTLYSEDKSVFQSDATITSATEGKIEYVIPSEAIRHHGKTRGDLRLTYPNGDVLGGLRFSFNIEQALIDRAAGVVGGVYIRDFEQLKAEIEATAESIKDFDVVRIDTRLGELEEQIGEGVGVDEQARQEIQEVTEQLAETAKKSESIINLAEPKWGLKINGNDDDTDAFERVLQYATDNGYKILLPKGTIKITRPITINYASNSSFPPVSFVMEGLGGVSGGILTDYGSKIKAYNIPDTRGAIELLGLNNGLITSVTIENVQIDIDEETCGELAFCLKIGDSWFFTIRKCKFVGFNNVMLRCGTGPGARSYANMMCKFDQCHFETTRYLKWDGENVNEKAKYGFAIANERLFYDNGYTAYASDSITYDTCYFTGQVFNYVANSVFLNCMWGGNYRLDPVSITNDSRFNSLFLKDITQLDMSIGLWVAGGKTNLISPYFESVLSCIYGRSLNGTSFEIDINQGSFITSLANGTFKGVPIDFKYAIKTQSPTGEYSKLRINGGTYSKNNSRSFKEGFVVNNGCPYLEVKQVNGLKSSDVIDNFSKEKEIRYPLYSKPSELVLEFVGKVGGTSFVLPNTDIDTYTIDNSYILKKIEVLTSAPLLENHSIVVKVNGNYHFQIKNIGTGHMNSSYIKKSNGINSEMYSVNNIPYLELKDQPSSQRKYSFIEGSVLSVIGTIEVSPSRDANTTFTVKIYFDS